MHGVRCTLVEPRPLKLTKAQRRYLEARTREDQLPEQPDLEDPNMDIDLDLHWGSKSIIDEASVQTPGILPAPQGSSTDADSGIFDVSCLEGLVSHTQQRSQSRRRLTTVGAETSDGGVLRPQDRVINGSLVNGLDAMSLSEPLLTVQEGGFHQLQACFLPSLWKGPSQPHRQTTKILDLLESCSLVVGLHPDQVE